jgi:hypothetical protein
MYAKVNLKCSVRGFLYTCFRRDVTNTGLSMISLRTNGRRVRKWTGIRPGSGRGDLNGGTWMLMHGTVCVDNRSNRIRSDLVLLQHTHAQQTHRLLAFPAFISTSLKPRLVHYTNLFPSIHPSQTWYSIPPSPPFTTSSTLLQQKRSEAKTSKRHQRRVLSCSASELRRRT